MGTTKQRYRLNTRILLIICFVTVSTAGLVAGGHYLRKRALADDSLGAANAALAEQHYAEACAHLKDYLYRYPDDLQQLQRYANTSLKISPLTPDHVGAAIGAFRRTLRLQPDNPEAARRLAALYVATQNHSELRHLAEQQLRLNPDSPKAALWLTSAMISQGDPHGALRRLEPLIETLRAQPKHREQLVDACLQASEIATRTGAPPETALKWLNLAVETESPRAYAQRAVFYRTQREALPDIPLAQIEQQARADLRSAGDANPADPRIRLLLSQEWMAHGNFPAAARELEHVADLSDEQLAQYFLRPADWTTLHFKQAVELAIRRGAPEAMLERTRSVLAEAANPQRRLALLPSAIELFAAAGEVELAEQHYNQFTEQLLLQGARTRHAEVPALLAALIADARGEHYAVINHLQAFIDSDVRRPKIHSLLASALAETNQHRRAARVFRRYLQREPDDQSATLQLVRELLRARVWRDAVEHAALALQRWPQSGTAQLLSAEARVRALAEAAGAQQRVDIPQLRRDLAALQDAAPNVIDIPLLQAELARLTGHTEQASALLRAAAERFDDPVPAQLMLVRLHAQAGDVERALDEARQLCEAHPQAEAAWCSRAGLLAFQGDLAAARAVLDAGIEAAPNPAAKHRIRAHRALLELRLGDRAAAIDQLVTLAREQPDDARLRSLLLDIPAVRTSPRAAQLIAELRALEGENGILWRVHEAARLLADQDNWRSHQQRIRQQLETCIDSNPGWQPPVLLLGEMYDRLGADARAEAVYRRALAANDDADSVREALLASLERQGRFAEVTKLLEQHPTHASPDPVRTALRSVRAGAWEQAAAQLEAHLESNQLDPRAQALLVRSRFRATQDADAALQALREQGVERFTALPVARAVADILYMADREPALRAHADRVVDTRRDADAYVLRAEVLQRLGDIQGAERDFQQARTLSDAPAGDSRLGRFYLEIGRLNDAVRLLRAAHDAAPDQLATRAALADALLKRAHDGDLAAAAALAESSADSDDASATDLILRARVARERDTPAARRAAHRMLTDAVERDPSRAAAYLHLCELEAQRGNFSAAQQWTVRGLGALPRHPLLLLARASTELRLGNHDLTRQLADTAFDQPRPTPAALAAYGEIALELQDRNRAQAAEEALANITPELQSSKTLRVRARLLEQLDQRDAAIALLQEARHADRFARDAELVMVLAELRYRRGETEAAGALLQDLLDEAPDNHKLRRAAVLWYANTKSYDQIQRLVTNRPIDDLPAARLATMASAALVSSNSAPYRATAIDLLRKTVDRFPDLVQPRIALAYAYFADERVADAERMYRAALELQPSHPRVLNDLAWILAQREQYDEALEFARRAVRLDPGNANAYDTRAAILEGLGRLSDARLDRQRNVSLLSGAPARQAQALAKLAELYTRLGDEDAAERAARRAAALQPSSTRTDAQPGIQSTAR